MSKFIKNSELENEFDNLISSLERGELREQQINLSKQIAICLNRHENGIYQAGTGIGKSFAYLIPAILSERKMVISTATKQLSSQIANKDLKILKDILFPDLKYLEVQGAGNYICMKNFDKFFFSDEKNPEINLYIGVDKTYDEVKDLPDEEILPELKANAFARDKFESRINDIKFLYKIKDLWTQFETNQITSEDFRKISLDCSGNCLREISCEHCKCVEKGNVCEFMKTCPYQELQKEMTDTDIIVTNHAYVGAHMNKSFNNHLFSGRDLWIADEGHELEQYLVKSFSSSISTRNLRQLLEKLFYPGIETKLFSKLSEYSADEDGFKRAYRSLETEVQSFIDTLRSYSKIFELTEDKKDRELPDSVSAGLRGIIKSINEKSKIILQDLEGFYSETKQLSNAYFELAEINSSLVEIAQASEDRQSYIFWLEYKKKSDSDEFEVVLHSTNIKVGEKLQAFLGSLNKEKVKNKSMKINENKINLITLSATMKIGKSFDEFKELICADKSFTRYNTYDAGTVFDYNSQGMLYIPENIPDVKTERDLHFEKFKYETVRLINSSGGGALVLCTTSAEADQIYELLEKLFGKKLHIFNYKESRNKDIIIEKFREDRDSVLVGTRGFFQGIDVQGVSLRLVCINKIPFPTPDCVSEAKSKIYAEEGKNAFRLTSIVPATQTLLQATGRLIRHTTDNGVVMLMDNRITNSRNSFWLAPLIDSIPDFYKTSKFEEIDDFFRKLKQII